VGENQLTQLCAAAGGSLETRCRNDPKISGNLHYSARKRQARTVTALGPDGALASDRTCLDHTAVAGGHQQRDHAGLRKVDLIDRITRAVAYHSLRQGTLP